MKALLVLLITATASLAQANEFEIRCDFADQTVEIARTDLEGQIVVGNSSCVT